MGKQTAMRDFPARVFIPRPPDTDIEETFNFFNQDALPPHPHPFLPQ